MRTRITSGLGSSASIYRPRRCCVNCGCGATRADSRSCTRITSGLGSSASIYRPRRELRVRGYEGGLTILRDFVRPLKQEFVRRLTERFETLAGQQAQIDWGECGTICVDGATP